MFTSRDTGYFGNLIKGIFSNLLKGIWDTILFTSRNIGYWYPPPPYTSLKYVSMSPKTTPFSLELFSCKGLLKFLFNFKAR